jgi:hypothetical protein
VVAEIDATPPPDAISSRSPHFLFSLMSRLFVRNLCFVSPQAFRKANNVDKILENPDFPSHDLIRTLIPYAYHGEDKEGRPIYIERTGMIATAALADENIARADHLLHSHIYGVELMQRRMYEISLRKGERVNGICTILDFEGLGFHHRQCLFVLKTLLDFDKKYYPEYLGKLYVINTPWVGPYLYQAVQVFLDEVTKARVSGSIRARTHIAHAHAARTRS